MTPTASEAAARRLLSEAEGYAALGLHADALERIEAVERTGRFPYECAFLRGESHRDRGQHAEALPSYRRSLQERPGDVAATVGLGWCLKRLGQVDRAAEAYEAALGRHPDEALLSYNLACYKSLLGRADEAVALLARSIGMQEVFRELAASEEDFGPIRHLPAFRKLLRPPAPT